MTTISVPKKLAIYYAYPSLVNSSTTIVQAATVFKDYDLVVFGATLEENTHPDHTNTQNIINHSLMVNTEVYGYIDSMRTLADFKSRVDKWKAMGVKGIFCDRIGYDFGITRSKQNSIVNYIHGKSLKAFIDAWDPDDVFSSAINLLYNPTGIASVLGSGDWYLAQSYLIINGGYQDPTFWKTKADKMQTYKTSIGTKMACVTTYDNSAFDQDKLDYAYYGCVLYNFDAFGFGEDNFSATSALLPLRTRKLILGTKFTTAITNHMGIYERQTNIGIHIDTSTHAVSVNLN